MASATQQARTMVLVLVVVIVLTPPFGWIGGQLSEMNRALSFVLLIGLFLVGIALTFVAGRLAEKTASAAPS